MALDSAEMLRKGAEQIKAIIEKKTTENQNVVITCDIEMAKLIVEAMENEATYMGEKNYLLIRQIDKETYRIGVNGQLSDLATDIAMSILNHPNLMMLFYSVVCTTLYLNDNPAHILIKDLVGEFYNKIKNEKE